MKQRVRNKDKATVIIGKDAAKRLDISPTTRLQWAGYIRKCLVRTAEIHCAKSTISSRLAEMQ